MPRKANELTALAVRNLNRPGLHFVGGVAGLALQVLPTGGRSWILRAMIGGRRRDMGLGGYPDVPLGEAREAARRARELVRNGVDPIDQAQAARSSLKADAAKATTFRQAAEAYIAGQTMSWKNAKHRSQWASTLKTYAYPVIGDLAVSDIEAAHVHKILDPIWGSKTETANRVRNRIELVIDWAIARGHRTASNPARWKGHLDKIFPKRRKVAPTQHHRALPIDEMYSFMSRLHDVDGTGARALEIAILTAARSGEVRGMTWYEIDLSQRVWTIPKERMKAGREHRVPLSPPAVELLERLPKIGGTGLVFPGARGPLSDMTLAAVLRRMGIDAVPHGFRSTFRDWAAERTNHPTEVAEMALAHTIKNQSEAAYRRGDLMEKRRRLAEDWATFCYSPPDATGKVVELRRP
ncbi:site-specific integrase [uncultured Brevundimonas sp.]|uniref:tyrosine-type recombinase/integrase n=1 Tax=uncultured Brevundimonas sp. TaxID=213418 RepID=UPI0025FC087F|nr:site-specific integrase [uncultured Brevundimonas sp.]